MGLRRILCRNSHPDQRKHVARTTVGDPAHFASGAMRVTVVGQECIGQIEARLTDWARRLARVTGVELLEVLFSGSEADPRFEAANPWPDLSQVEVADAVLHFLQTR